MLNEKFGQKPPPLTGPRQSGQTVTNPRSLIAIAIKNAAANNQSLTPQSPLAAAIAKKKKKTQGY